MQHPLLLGYLPALNSMKYMVGAVLTISVLEYVKMNHNVLRKNILIRYYK